MDWSKTAALRKTCALVDLDAYKDNLRAIRSHLKPGCKLMAVVKADAYGHGLVPIAKAAQEAKADWLGVALVEEGIVLREAGITLPILVLSGQGLEATCEAVRHGLVLTAFTPRHVQDAQLCARRLGVDARVHIKLDTGMNRIGVKTDEALSELLSMLTDMPKVKLTGAYTHFASADNLQSDMTYRQLRRFHELIARLPQDILLHTSGSSALLKREDAQYGMARAGIATYGYSPVKTDVPLKMVMKWLAEITHVKYVESGETISYGATFVASKPMRVATLAVGYGDGYARLLSGKAQVLVHGKRCDVLGRVCMDQMMVDVSEVEDVQPGQQAVLLGSDGAECVTADELANLLGTISYEVLLSISARVPRVYIKQGMGD